MSRDVFRPLREPARTLYDAFQKEVLNRAGRDIEQWQGAERGAVWLAARDYAQQHGLRVPTIAEVNQAGNLAYGHIDYGAKWAYGVARTMVKVVQAAEGE
ncbi:hypothetical protein LCGC14_1204720 [marine sediment metagenome]|uniref:Uncharacterized protein n=1 Tax=marine sediment metagenome TaxID=412755 RepID=A0A0F9PKP0_9ZZZZ